MTELERWRTLLGRTSVLWAGQDGFRERDSSWLALSGCKSIEFNVALCHEATEAGRGVQETIDEVLASGMPTVLMLAGSALGDAQVLVEAGWICIGTLPLMHHAAGAGDLDTAVRRVGPAELPAVRNLVAEAFNHTPELAAVAIPDTAVALAGQSVWGLFDADDLVSCIATVRVEEASGWWSLATPPRLQGRGYGSRLCRGVFAEEAREGVIVTLAWCTPAGRRATSAVGFTEVERWQLWSRPRWVLARR